MSRARPTKPIAIRAALLGGLSAALCTASLSSGVPAAHAEEPPIPGGSLPVPAVDVTDTDANLASAAREVVVSVATPQGPELTKLRVATPAAAETLAADLDARPGVAAQANEVIRVDSSGVAANPGAVASAGRPKPDTPVSVRGSRSNSTSASGTVAALASEPLGTRQWGLRAVGAEGAWPITRGDGVTVAVIDTGVDATHPDLAGHVLPGIDMVGDGLSGDPAGHGTHVSGIIAAALDGSGVAGLANQVTILPVRSLNADGAGDIYTLAGGINEAVAAGADVLNLSLGGPSSNPVLKAAIDNALSRGVTVVSAVGNSYREGNPVEYPAGFAGVIGVASIDEQGRSSWFSNAGSHVDISAPGEGILSTVPGGDWEAWDGTSMATPFVAAAAALVRVANPSYTPAQISSTLTGTAADDASRNGRDRFFGYGLLRADRAVAKAAGAPYGRNAPAATAKVRATSGKSKLRVDVNPNKGSGFWTFRVQTRQVDGTWAALPTEYRTSGSAETRTINLPKGRYRVVVAAKYGYQQATSAAVTLKR